jgi:hypothetical protein
MGIQRFAGNEMTGVAGDTKPSHSQLIGWRFLETDTGNRYVHDGANWVLVQGAAKTETLTNKTLDVELNTFSSMLITPFSTSYKRAGYMLPCADASKATLAALSGWPTNGTLTTVNDATEGYVNDFNSSTNNAVIGYLSNSTFQVIAQRTWNAFIKAKIKPSTTTNTRCFVGFSSATTLPTTDTIFGNTDHGCFVGFNTATANWSVFNNDAGGAMPSATSMGVAKNAGWRTIELSMASGGNITCKLDGANTTTISSRLPGNTTNIYAYVVMVLAAASSTSLDIKGISFRSDK